MASLKHNKKQPNELPEHLQDIKDNVFIEREAPKHVCHPISNIRFSSCTTKTHPHNHQNTKNKQLPHINVNIITGSRYYRS